MSENFNSHIACEGTDNDINWVCKVCKDLPNYAGMYLYQREREKNQLKNVKDRRADLILLKYYYALLHLLDKIHELHECPNPENDVPKYADRKCSTPECFVYYRYIYNTYASILMTEKGLNQINLSHLPGRRKTSRSFIRRKACPASTGGETTSGCFLCVPKTK